MAKSKQSKQIRGERRYVTALWDGREFRTLTSLAHINVAMIVHKPAFAATTFCAATEAKDSLHVFQNAVSAAEYVRWMNSDRRWQHTFTLLDASAVKEVA